MSAIPSADEVMAISRMALDEAGYEHVELTPHPCSTTFGYPDLVPIPCPPPAVCWQVGWIVYRNAWPCWACWSIREGAECVAGNCLHPEGPARPPRELLRAS